MTKAEREARIAEAIEWMREDGGKLPGWGEDRMAAEDKLATALLESLLLAYPQINLIAILAACRVHWMTRGPTTPRAWCRRIQNWVKGGAEWDPLISGRPRSTPACPESAGRDHGPRTADRKIPGAQRSVVSGQLSSGPVPAADVVKGELAKMKRLVEG